MLDIGWSKITRVSVTSVWEGEKKMYNVLEAQPPQAGLQLPRSSPSAPCLPLGGSNLLQGSAKERRGEMVKELWLKASKDGGQEG